MFDRILVPLDGSFNAEAILQPLGGIVGTGAEVSLVHVLPLGASGLDAASGIMIEPEQAERYFADVRCRFPALGDRTIIERGDPIDGILRSAEKSKVGLIAMATHGRTGLRRLIMGSVAERVVRRSSFPVLLVRHGAPARSRAVRRILLPLESADGSDRIASTVGEMSRRTKAEVILFHVTNNPKGKQAKNSPAALVDIPWLAGVVEQLGKDGVGVKTTFATGNPAKAILAEAAAADVDLIAMVTRGRRGVSRLRLGSVAEAVLRRACVPVLLQHVAKGGLR